MLGRLLRPARFSFLSSQFGPNALQPTSRYRGSGQGVRFWVYRTGSRVPVRSDSQLSETQRVNTDQTEKKHDRKTNGEKNDDFSPRRPDTLYKKKLKKQKGPTRSCSLSRDEISSIATNVCIHIKYNSFLCTGRVFWVFGG